MTLPAPQAWGLWGGALLGPGNGRPGVWWHRLRGAANKLVGTSLRFWTGWRHLCCYRAGAPERTLHSQPEAERWNWVVLPQDLRNFWRMIW